MGISWLLYFSLSTTLVTEFIITSALCILLSRHRSTFAKVDFTIRTLILYTVNTGALTTLCTLLCIVAVRKIFPCWPTEFEKFSTVQYAVLPYSFAFMAFYFLLPKLFLNSLLATFNARDSLRKRMGADLAAFSLGPPLTHGRQSIAETARHSARTEGMIGVLEITGSATHLGTNHNWAHDPCLQTVEEEGVSGEIA
ncbi:hypothetical protein LXA43DRAFT_18814 [Ganoderma leucocontextum]|nr:hypothetical protein LXA43DRAFT_18814 [Ganoderma leucocontextum]